jgi:hypothetical protein
MWNLLLAGIVGGVAYLALKDNKKEESKKEEQITPTSKKKIVRSKKANAKNEASLDLLYEIDKDGFDYAINSYSDYREMQDVEFDKLRQNFIKKSKAFEKYIELKNPVDSEYDEYAQDVLSNQGLTDGFLGENAYHDFKGVKDTKFQKLYSETNDAYNQLFTHLKKKFKIKDFRSSELQKAIDKLEGQ